MPRTTPQRLIAGLTAMALAAALLAASAPIALAVNAGGVGH